MNFKNEKVCIDALLCSNGANSWQDYVILESARILKQGSTYVPIIVVTTTTMRRRKTLQTVPEPRGALSIGRWRCSIAGRRTSILSSGTYSWARLMCKKPPPQASMRPYHQPFTVRLGQVSSPPPASSLKSSHAGAANQRLPKKKMQQIHRMQIGVHNSHQSYIFDRLRELYIQSNEVRPVDTKQQLVDRTLDQVKCTGLYWAVPKRLHQVTWHGCGKSRLASI